MIIADAHENVVVYPVDQTEIDEGTIADILSARAPYSESIPNTIIHIIGHPTIDFDAITTLALQVRSQQASFHIASSERDLIEELDDVGISAVPTVTEAIDMVYMEDIERELNMEE